MLKVANQANCKISINIQNIHGNEASTSEVSDSMAACLWGRLGKFVPININIAGINHIYNEEAYNWLILHKG